VKPDSHLVEPMERGYKGTSQTVKRMHQLVQQAKLDPTIQKIAYWIRANVGDDDSRGKGKELATAIFQWVRDSTLFTRDPFQIEKIDHPLAALKPLHEAKRAGAYTGKKLFAMDCDGYTILIASLGGALGYQYSFETVKTDPDRPDEYSHIYPALLVNGEWVSLDASTPSAYVGWRPPVSKDKFKRWNESPVEDLGMAGINGNGLGYGYAQPGYWGYGVPMYYEGPGKTPTLKQPDPGRMVVIPPEQPAAHAQDLNDFKGYGEFDMSRPEDSPFVVPEEQPFGPPYYRSTRPGISVDKPFPPDWPWKYQVEVRQPGPEDQLYGSAQTQATGEVPATSDLTNQGVAGMGNNGWNDPGYLTPYDLNRAETAAHKSGVLKPGALGEDLSYYDPFTDQSLDESQFSPSYLQDQVNSGTLVPYLPSTFAPAAKKVEEAGDDVWDTIGGVLTNVASKIPDLGQSWVNMQSTKLDTKLEEAKAATLAAAARNQIIARQGGAVSRGSTGSKAGDFLKSPFVWMPLAGAVVLGGVMMIRRMKG
jgi:hypothetical protein